MKSNAELQQDVQDAIKWQPLLNAAEIGVTAKDGVVSLTGVVDSYSKKTEAEDAAKNVAGVTALVEKIEVKYPTHEWYVLPLRTGFTGSFFQFQSGQLEG